MWEITEDVVCFNIDNRYNASFFSVCMVDLILPAGHVFYRPSIVISIISQSK